MCPVHYSRTRSWLSAGPCDLATGNDRREVPGDLRTQLARAQRTPEPGLGIGGRLPLCVSVKSEGVVALRHERLLSPGWRSDEALAQEV